MKITRLLADSGFCSYAPLSFMLGKGEVLLYGQVVDLLLRIASPQVHTHARGAIVYTLDNMLQWTAGGEACMTQAVRSGGMNALAGIGSVLETFGKKRRTALRHATHPCVYFYTRNDRTAVLRGARAPHTDTETRAHILPGGSHIVSMMCNFQQLKFRFTYTRDRRAAHPLMKSLSPHRRQHRHIPSWNCCRQF